VTLHVFTESNRTVPAPYVKHDLIDWQISGPKKSWWYKMQLFNPDNFTGPVMYFDLDVVVLRNIDWIWQKSTRYFWAIKDFKYLWRPNSTDLNSSIMWWDSQRFSWIWKDFCQNDLRQQMRRFPGDQDYLSHALPAQHRRYFDGEHIKSWRWQTLDGGYDFRRKTWKNPGAGTNVDALTSVLVFHGQPKPHEINDSVVQGHWQ
jgi:hypothetical protein